MKVKNVRKTEYFTSTDGCRITETFGIPSEGVREASVAYAILPPGKGTDAHMHNFIEWYIITEGAAVMKMGDEERPVAAGDNILIPKGSWHSISATGNRDLEFYCFCVPPFTLEGTVMKDGSKAKESVERDWK
jgi:mannose-6-phosphate isomerase-like protein (cupin superfamily)